MVGCSINLAQSTIYNKKNKREIKIMKIMENIFMFDVESTSLHGRAIAVGAVVADLNGKIIDSLEVLSTESLNRCCDFVKKNILPNLEGMPTVNSDRALINEFWKFYDKYRENSEIWSDVNYPVETNFLEMVYRNDPENRWSKMPYPLMDASNYIPENIDRVLMAQSSLKEKLRKHNPKDDARASLHCLFEFYFNGV
jgi:hypothetical protein